MFALWKVSSKLIVWSQWELWRWPGRVQQGSPSHQLSDWVLRMARSHPPMCAILGWKHAPALTKPPQVCSGQIKRKQLPLNSLSNYLSTAGSLLQQDLGYLHFCLFSVGALAYYSTTFTNIKMQTIEVKFAWPVNKVSFFCSAAVWNSLQLNLHHFASFVHPP